jgi:hypothetical protein
MEANSTLSPGAFGTQSWADPARGIICVLMISLDKLQRTSDDSARRRAYQQAVAGALDGR